MSCNESYCEDCPLRDRVHVPPHVPQDARLLVIGETATPEEARERVPFCGTAGEMLRNTLRQCGVSADSVAYVNAVNCCPDPGAAVPVKAISRCRGVLEAVLDRVRPAAILAVGAPAAHALLGEKAAISTLIGTHREIVLPGGGTAYAYFVYHPSYVLRSGGSPLIRRRFCDGVAAAAEAVRKAGQDHFSPTLEFERVVPGTLSELSDALDEIAAAGRDHVIAFDVETRHAAIYGTVPHARTNCILCCSFALSPMRAVAVPLAHAESPFRATDADGFAVVRDDVRELIVRKLSGPLRLVGHNIGFDLLVAHRMLGLDLYGADIDDTMLLHTLCSPDDLSKGLKPIASALLGIPNYDIADKYDLRYSESDPAAQVHLPSYQPADVVYPHPVDYARAPLEDLLLYNMQDVISTLRILPIYKQRVAQVQNQVSGGSSIGDFYASVLRQTDVILSKLTRDGIHLDRRRFDEIATMISDARDRYHRMAAEDDRCRQAAVLYALHKERKLFDMKRLASSGQLVLSENGAAAYVVGKHYKPADRAGREAFLAARGLAGVTTQSEVIRRIAGDSALSGAALRETDQDVRLSLIPEMTRRLADDELARLSYTAITAGAWQLLFLLASGYDMSTLARTATGNLSAPKTLWETLGTQSGAADWKNETVYGAIHQYRLMTKLESTYLQALSEKYLDWKDGRVHAQFKMMSTRTGRLASSEPNLQNLPTSEGYVKEIYAAPPGKVFLHLDFSQAEVRVMAALSRDPGLCEVCDSGQDVHSGVAKRIFGLDCPVEEVKSRYPDKRRDSKRVVFGLLYGMSTGTLARNYHMSWDEAETVVSSFFSAMPRVKQWIDGTHAFARAEGYVETPFGRRRYLADVYSGDPGRAAGALRQAQNTPIQATASDCLLTLMRLADSALRRHPEWGAMLVGTVHDSMTYEVLPQHAEDLKQLLREQLRRMNAILKRGWLVTDIVADFCLGTTEHYDESLSDADVLAEFQDSEADSEDAE